MRPAGYTDLQLRIRVLLMGALLCLLVTSALAIGARFGDHGGLAERATLNAGAPETPEVIRQAPVPEISVIPDDVGNAP